MTSVAFALAYWFQFLDESLPGMVLERVLKIYVCVCQNIRQMPGRITRYATKRVYASQSTLLLECKLHGDCQSETRWQALVRLCSVIWRPVPIECSIQKHLFGYDVQQEFGISSAFPFAPSQLNNYISKTLFYDLHSFVFKFC
jgi:hypothetical protein